MFRSWQSNANLAGEFDFECPMFDMMKKEPGCQVRCDDSECTHAQKTIAILRSTQPTAHMVFLHCPLSAGQFVTIKGGDDMRSYMPGDTLCKRRCNGELSRVGLHYR